LEGMKPKEHVQRNEMGDVCQEKVQPGPDLNCCLLSRKNCQPFGLTIEN